MPSLFAVVGLLGAWLVPLNLPPWVSWHHESLAFAAMICLAVTLLTRHKENYFQPIPWPYAALVAVALCGVSLLQFGTGHIPFFGDVLVLLLYLTLSMFMVVVGFHIAQTSAVRAVPSASWTSVDGAAAVLLLGAFLSVVIALVQVFDVWEQSALISRMPGLRRPGGNLDQPNQLGTLLVMGMACIGYLYESRKASAVLATILLTILIVGVTLTESRTAILSCLLMAAWLFFGRKKAGLRTSPWVVVSGCVALFALLWGWPQFFTYVQDAGIPSREALRQINTSTGTRLLVWTQLIDAVLQKPWTGWGLLGVPEAHNAVLHNFASAEPFSYAHNIILDLAVGMGLPLTLLLVTVMAVWFWRRVSATTSLLPWYCLAVVLPFGVHSMLEFPFAYAYFLVPVMFAVGMLEATLAPNNVVLVGRLPAALGFSLVTVLMAWSVVEYIAIEEDFRIVRFEALHVGQTPSDYERPKIYLLTQLDALLEAGRIVPEPDMAPERIELSRKVAMRYPWTATQNRYALSLALNGNAQEAVRQLKVMRAMHGEKTYESIKANWTELANTKYPQLKVLALP
jgi:O-antigen ligase